MNTAAVLERGLTITNPLVLYRALLSLKQIDPDPGQHRLAIHLQDLYTRLKDYEPAVEYNQKLTQLSDTLKNEPSNVQAPRIPIWRAQENTKTKALVRSLTSHEGALEIQSPKGLLLHGEVGTGKSMLVDLLADSLPTGKKRRWHFNTFMLEVLTKIEKLRLKRIAHKSTSELDEETPLLAISRDLVLESPILFLDEFQLPDKAASKILSHLFTCFFQLGGVLVATSNRMPEELDKASGIEFVPPAPRTAFTSLRESLLGRVSNQSITRPQQSDFAKFLEVLRARCEVWEIEGNKDWRRRESGSHAPVAADGTMSVLEEIDILPKHYLVNARQKFQDSVAGMFPQANGSYESIPWQTKSIRVYGRDLLIPRCVDGVSLWTFKDLCFARLGPADYVSLASTFHTFIVENVPILSLLNRSEARRFITLLDALYEARAKLLIQAEAGPDDIFFPETRNETSSDGFEDMNADGTYAETFSEIYQDQTAPFRPNISSYAAPASTPDYAPQISPSTRHGMLANRDTRSILADEDADFGPVYGAGRSQGSEPNRPGLLSRETTEPPKEDTNSPNFQQSSVFTGEDERFAYKRARSRLWEMCSQRWWDRQEQGWWRPVSASSRTWERDVNDVVRQIEVKHSETKAVDQDQPQPVDEMFKHGASPFRVNLDPPPKFGWVHAWGMTQWGKRAGLWGQGADRFGDVDQTTQTDSTPDKSKKQHTS